MSAFLLPGHWRMGLKNWIVDTFANVDTAPVVSVVCAKVIHRCWPGFKHA